MTFELSKAFEYIKSIVITCDSESVLREKTTALLERTHSLCKNGIDKNDFEYLNGITRGCHLILRKLNNVTLCSNNKDKYVYAESDLREFVVTLCSACDLILYGTGRRLHLVVPSKPVVMVFEPNSLQTALLNLISNAAKFNDGHDIFLHLQEKKTGAHISVVNQFDSDVTRLQNMSKTKGSGLCAVRKASQLNGGTILFSSTDDFTTVSVSISSILLSDNKPYAQPSFSDLICNRMSPIYTGLCEICSCPL